MEKETFALVRMIIATVVAALCSISVVQSNYILPIIVGATAAVFIYAMKKRVTGVIADERDYQISGQAARWSVSIYCVVAAIGSLILMAERARNIEFELIAQVLAYSACAILILQSLLFKYLQDKK